MLSKHDTSGNPSGSPTMLFTYHPHSHRPPLSGGLEFISLGKRQAVIIHYRDCNGDLLSAERFVRGSLEIKALAVVCACVNVKTHTFKRKCCERESCK